MRNLRTICPERLSWIWPTRVLSWAGLLKRVRSLRRSSDFLLTETRRVFCRAADLVPTRRSMFGWPLQSGLVEGWFFVNPSSNPTEIFAWQMFEDLFFDLGPVPPEEGFFPFWFQPRLFSPEEGFSGILFWRFVTTSVTGFWWFVFQPRSCSARGRVHSKICDNFCHRDF